MKNTWLWDEDASDEYKGMLIISALENMCGTIVWFYGQNYKGNMETMVKQFRLKQKTADQKKKFTAAELERHIDLAFQTWAECVAQQVSDLEKDKTFNEECT